MEKKTSSPEWSVTDIPQKTDSRQLKSSSMDLIYVRKASYPEEFEQDYQLNLQYFADGVGIDPVAKVPYDLIDVVNGSAIKARLQMNSTALGLYLHVLVEMERANSLIARQRLIDVITLIDKMPKWNGLAYWMYQIELSGKLSLSSTATASAVDAANLITSLAAVAGAYWHDDDPRMQNLAKQVDAIIRKTAEGWYSLFDQEKGLLKAAWSLENNDYAEYHIDRKSNESRLAPLWAHLITRETSNEIPIEAFTKMQAFTANYLSCNGDTLAPLLTWKGAYFQAMLPSIWFDEYALVPNPAMFDDLTQVQIDFTSALNIPFLSSASTIDAQYSEFGVDAMSEHFCLDPNESVQTDVGSPHATALSAILDPTSAVTRLKAVKAKHPQIAGPYGWYDAINSHGDVVNRLIGLDQGMFVNAFLATQIQQDVKCYIISSFGQPAWDAVEAMYASFIADGSYDNRLKYA
ncbi:glucoamylase family protein [Vibrio celticus]|uniref:Uncharacterized protein n=1 Tax=Vibrio celticus TaxID=446372 RepID=A0A1C3J862_9VIBR|nr:glucoamylase family protein [Vibrio celticus]SBT11313.1 hypothetical protein VCE7224_00029 [Vibrio celticus]